MTADNERRVRVAPEGRAARTIFRRVRTWPDADPPVALLEAELETGRTHQIRVHLTHLGFPLAATTSMEISRGIGRWRSRD